MDNNLRGVPVEGFADKSREAAVEGIVLLKNENNTLPLTEQDKVSVFGRPMIEYYRSGTGSGGAVNVNTQQIFWTDLKTAILTLTRL